MILSKKLTLSVVFLTFLSIAKAQFNPFYNDITPPSPESIALAKYADVPISYYNGLPKIDIPLYTLQGRDIKFPLKLNYHASGVRVEEDASWVGLGWSLSAGGVITRTVMGNDDFADGSQPGWFSNPIGYLYSDPTPTGSPPQSYLEDICNAIQDSKPDIFYYNFHGYSGKFILKQKPSVNPNSPVEVILLSNDMMRVSYDEVAKAWTFITIDGLTYTFGTYEESQTWNGQGNNPGDLDRTAVFPDQMYNTKTITTWHLDKIESTLGEVFRFNYKSGPHSSITDSYTEIRKTGLSPDPDFPCPPQGKTQPATRVGTLLHYVESIEISGGDVGINLRVEFETSDRDDIAPYSKYELSEDRIVTYGLPQRLDFIKVYDNSAGLNELLKQISFNTSYFQSSVPTGMHVSAGKRLRLDVLEFKDKVSAKVNEYSFEYNYEKSLPLKYAYSKDYWGYFNGKDNTGDPNNGINPTLIPQYVIDYVPNGARWSLPGADRQASVEHAKANVLKKINYPTGGYLELDYELNEYRSKGVHFSSDQFKDFEISVEGNDRKFLEISEVLEISIEADLHYTPMICHSSANKVEYKDVPSGGIVVEVYDMTAQSQKFTLDFFHMKECVVGDPTGIASCTGIEALGLTTAPCGARKRGVLTLQPGRYYFETNSPTDWLASTKIKFRKHLPTENLNIYNQKGGGLRVKKTVLHDGVSHDNDIVRKLLYQEVDENGSLVSSGRAMNYPLHHYQDELKVHRSHSLIAGRIMNQLYSCYELVSTSYSSRPLSNSAAGGYVGYNRVIEMLGENGENGKNIYSYINQSAGDIDNWQPNAPNNEYAYKNGNLVSKEVYDINNRLIRETTNQYDSSELFNDYYFFSRNTGPCQDKDCFIPGTAYESCVGTFPNYFYTWYQIKNIFYYLKRSTDKIFDLNASSEYSISKTYAYNNVHKQLTSIITDFGDDGTQEEQFLYPLDVPSPPNFFINKHIHTKPIEVSIFRNGSQIKGEKFEYSLHENKGNKVLLDEVLVYNSEIDGFESRYKLRYNTYGGLTEVDDRGKLTSYIWGFNNSLPIIRAENVSYHQLKAAFDQGLDLQTEFPDGYIEFYNHKPGVGLIEKEDVNGLVMNYEYDDFGRIKRMLDHQGNRLFEMEYQYLTHD